MKQQYYKKKKTANKQDEATESKKHASKPQGQFKPQVFNDPNWYGTPESRRLIGNLGFGDRIGDNVLVGFESGNPMYQNVPGIGVINLIPSIGVGDSWSSAANMAATANFAAVTHAIGRPSTYEPADLMLVQLAITSCYNLYSTGVRLYGVANSIIRRNRYIPRDMIKALGFNPEDVLSHLAELRYGLEVIANKLAQLPGLSTDAMPYAERQYWLTNLLYKDVDTEQSQVFAFVWLGYWKFALDSRGAGKLSVIPGFANATVSDYLTRFNTMFDAIINDQDFQEINRDMLKAFGANGMRTPDRITDDYTVVPVYDKQVLFQIKHMLVPRYSLDVGDGMSCEVFQNTTTGSDNYGALYQDLVSTINVADDISKDFFDMRFFLDSEDDEPSCDEVFESTRLMAVPEIVKVGDESRIHVRTCGSEIPISFTVYTYSLGTLTTVEYLPIVLMSSSAMFSLEWVKQTYLSKFTNAPFIYSIGANSSYVSQRYLPFGGVSNYTMVNPEYIDKLHTAALLGEFKIDTGKLFSAERTKQR